MRARRIIIWVLLVVIFLSTVIILLKGFAPGVIPAPHKIAVIHLSGPIQETAAPSLLQLSPQGITPERVRNFLERAEKDGVRAVVLRIESPGGSVGASQEIAKMIKEFPKPIVISMGDLVVSGGYYISAYADAIVANPGSLTGSIGVIAVHLNLEELLKKWGIEIETIISGKHKDMFMPHRKLTPEEREISQRICDELYAQFIETVAQGRKLDKEKVLELATGEIFTATQALKLGLIDEIGGLDTAIKRAAKLAGIERYKIVRYAPSLFEIIFGGLSEFGFALKAKILGEELALLLEALNHLSLPRY